MSRSNYWAHSKPVKWVRSKVGLANPDAMDAKGWNQHEIDCKRIAPVWDWITDEGVDMVQNAVMKPSDLLNSARYALYNRFRAKEWCLDTKLNKWQYHGVDNRILHGLFGALVDFVEVEKASWQYEEKDGVKWAPPWYARGWFNIFHEHRNAAAGLKYLEWEIGLKFDHSWMGYDSEDKVPAEDKAKPGYGEPTHQALKAQTTVDLYNWWKNVRPARPDPYDASGWTAHCENRRAKNGGGMWASLASEDETEDERAETRHALDELARLEKEYDEEDTEKLIELIKIRQGLWT